jgi:hypothetical protein
VQLVPSATAITPVIYTVQYSNGRASIYTEAWAVPDKQHTADGGERTARFGDCDRCWLTTYPSHRQSRLSSRSQQRAPPQKNSLPPDGRCALLAVQ